jgi:hypothetical protein
MRFRGRLGVTGIPREIEQADTEALIVHAIEDDGEIEGIGADDPVFCGVAHTFAAFGEGAVHGLARRNDDDVGIQRKAEFEGAAANDGAILGGKAEVQASTGIVAKAKQRIRLAMPTLRIMWGAPQAAFSVGAVKRSLTLRSGSKPAGSQAAETSNSEPMP